MRVTRIAMSLMAMGSLASAQTLLLQETWELGIPASWSNIQLGYLGDLWLPGFMKVDGTKDVYHEHFCDIGFFFRDNVLLSPPLDLGKATSASIDYEQNQLFGISKVYNAVVVSLDGGASFIEVFKDTATADGFSARTVSLSAFAGLPGVRVGFRYKGAIANEWSIDNVRVTATMALEAAPSALSLLAGGTQTMTLAPGASYAGQFYFLVGSLSGTSPGLPLPEGLVLPLVFDVYTQHVMVPNNPPLTGNVGVLDAAGLGTVTFTLPAGSNPNWAGVHFDHAYALVDASIPKLSFASNPAGLDLVP